jgi:hypothetical protein
MFCILRGLHIRPDVGHRETLILFARTVGTLPEILLALVKLVFTTTIEADIFSRADFLSC